MRCFPHCCPQHVERSYCGASVYLQVDLDKPMENSTASWDGERHDTLDDDSMLVFGRFRLQNVCGPALGEQISLDIIMSSLISETNPTGEWIESRMIASAGHNAWLFEINPSAKWYYCWEVGAARDRRTMPHVFEAYVFLKTTLSQSTAAPSRPVGAAAAHGTLSEPTESLEIVAFVASSPFTLISFRRAPAARATVNPSSDDRKQNHIHSNCLNDTRAAAPAEYERDVVAREETRFRLFELFEQRSEFDLDFSLDDLHTRNEEQEVDEQCDDSSESAMSRVAIAARNVMLAHGLLLQIPLRAVLPLVPVIEKTWSAALSERLGMSFTGGVTHDYATAGRQRITRLSAFHSRLMPPPRTEGLNLQRRANATDNGNQLVELSVKLLLWVLFDSDNNAQIERFLQRSATVLLDRDALYKSFQTWTEWLHERIDEFLFAQGWSLVGLVTQIEALVRTGEPIGFNNGTIFVDDAHVAAGHAMFVAQARELYISLLSLSPKAQFAQIQIHLQPRSATQIYSEHDSAGLLRFTGVWLCDLDETIFQAIGCGAARTDDKGQPLNDQEPIGIMTLLWVWKQLGCIRMAFSSEDGVPTLMIGSVFNPSLASATAAGVRLTRIVLDEQHRWFRCFPGGESTMGVRLGRQSFGDYVASIDDVDLTHSSSRQAVIKFYSWPSAGFHQASSLWPCVSPAPLPSAVASDCAAYCWSWQLSIHRDDHSDEAFMSANLTISSSHLTLNADARGNLGRECDPSLAGDMETWPLVAKLARVHHWEPISELHLWYRHLKA